MFECSRVMGYITLQSVLEPTFRGGKDHLDLQGRKWAEQEANIRQATKLGRFSKISSGKHAVGCGADILMCSCSGSRAENTPSTLFIRCIIKYEVPFLSLRDLFYLNQEQCNFSLLYFRCQLISSLYGRPSRVMISVQTLNCKHERDFEPLNPVDLTEGTAALHN
jgi:hypothetical protein